MECKTYKELRQFAKGFTGNHFNLIIVLGVSGIGKTETFCRAMKAKHLVIKGKWTPFVAYQALYNYRDQPVIVDDADELYETNAGKSLMKSLCETTANKTIRWQSKSIDDESMPREFATKSRVAVLVNAISSRNPHIKALMNRGHFIRFAPDNHEVHREIVRGKWFDDREVIDLIGRHIEEINPFELTFRHYIRAAEMKKARFETWAQHILGELAPKSKALLAVKEVLSDRSLKTEAERLIAYGRLMGDAIGGSRASYFRVKSQISSNGTTAKPCLLEG